MPQFISVSKQGCCFLEAQQGIKHIRALDPRVQSMLTNADKSTSFPLRYER